MNIDFNPIIQFLNDMAEKLTPAAQRVFELAVRQTITDGVINICGWLFLLVATIVSWKYVIKCFKKHEESSFTEDAETALGIWMLLSVILTAIFIYATVFGWLPSAISCLVNPEYQTLLKLLELIK